MMAVRIRQCLNFALLLNTPGMSESLRFSRNFGHQIAITAGMDYAEGDAIVVIDADLQDPVEVILEMADKWREGFEVVYGKRLERKGETLFKKLSAIIFYKILFKLTDGAIPPDVGDFRLIVNSFASPGLPGKQNILCSKCSNWH